MEISLNSIPRITRIATQAKRLDLTKNPTNTIPHDPCPNTKTWVPRFKTPPKGPNPLRK